jgi:hypothetical protein
MGSVKPIWRRHRLENSLAAHQPESPNSKTDFVNRISHLQPEQSIASGDLKIFPMPGERDDREWQRRAIFPHPSLTAF